jgi:hypothetical protein
MKEIYQLSGKIYSLVSVRLWEEEQSLENQQFQEIDVSISLHPKKRSFDSDVQWSCFIWDSDYLQINFSRAAYLFGKDTLSVVTLNRN